MNTVMVKVETHRVWATVGTEGAWQAWGSLLLAGYALGHFEDSDRVRKRWIIPTPGYIEHVPDYTESGAFYHNRPWLDRLIACNRDNQSWVDWDLESIHRRRRPIKDPTLQAIFFLLDHRGIDTSCLMRLTGADAHAFAEAHQAVMPYLERSPWHEKLKTINSRLQFIVGEQNVEIVLM